MTSTDDVPASAGTQSARGRGHAAGRRCAVLHAPVALRHADRAR